MLVLNVEVQRIHNPHSLWRGIKLVAAVCSYVLLQSEMQVMLFSAASAVLLPAYR